MSWMEWSWADSEVERQSIIWIYFTFDESCKSTTFRTKIEALGCVKFSDHKISQHLLFFKWNLWPGIEAKDNGPFSRLKLIVTISNLS